MPTNTPCYGFGMQCDSIDLQITPNDE